MAAHWNLWKLLQIWSNQIALADGASDLDGALKLCGSKLR